MYTHYQNSVFLKDKTSNNMTQPIQPSSFVTQSFLYSLKSVWCICIFIQNIVIIPNCKEFQFYSCSCGALPGQPVFGGERGGACASLILYVMISIVVENKILLKPRLFCQLTDFQLKIHFIGMEPKKSRIA